MSLYDSDFHAWALQQAELAKSRAHNEIDWPNVAEELESLGRQQRTELSSRYYVLIAHLLKWLCQPARRSRSWELTIAEQRFQISQLIEDSPSLKYDDDVLFARTYERARRRAAIETRLPLETFPQEPPFTATQARDETFLPDAPA